MKWGDGAAAGSIEYEHRILGTSATDIEGFQDSEQKKVGKVLGQKLANWSRQDQRKLIKKAYLRKRT